MDNDTHTHHPTHHIHTNTLLHPPYQPPPTPPPTPPSTHPPTQLLCKHRFHYRCVKTMLEKKWPGNAISFSFVQCPLCKVCPS